LSKRCFDSHWLPQRSLQLLLVAPKNSSTPIGCSKELVVVVLGDYNGSFSTILCCFWEN
jgi:hypothetical protein